MNEYKYKKFEPCFTWGEGNSSGEKYGEESVTMRVSAPFILPEGARQSCLKDGKTQFLSVEETKNKWNKECFRRFYGFIAFGYEGKNHLISLDTSVGKFISALLEDLGR